MEITRMAVRLSAYQEENRPAVSFAISVECLFFYIHSMIL